MKNIQISKDDVLRVFERIKGEATNLQMILKLKGAKYFQRPLAIGGILVVGSYYYAVQGTGGMLADLTLRVDGARATSTYAEEYKDLKGQINGINAKLPRVKNPQEWLLTEIRKTLREEGILPLSTSQPKDEQRKGYNFITITVNLQAGFPQIASWISRLERNKKLLYIKNLTLKKDSEDIGKNTVTVQVMTVAPGGGG